MFKYSEDKVPIAIIVGLSFVDIAAYFVFDQIWVLAAYWFVLIIPKGIISAWNHHHQHVLTFRSTGLNRVYEIFLAFHSGITTNLWVLHHSLGHHVHFLDQEKDESRWKRLSGKTMGMLEYTVNVAVTAYYRAFLVGKRYPRHQRVYLTWTTITFVILAVAFWFRPLAAFFVLVLPMVTSLLFTTWVTYDHHAGLESDNQFEASFNIMNRWFNILTGNLGYHTAHHYRQAVHWSKLPQLHVTIAEKIPERLFKKSTFDNFFPGEVRHHSSPQGTDDGCGDPEAQAAE